MKWEKEKRVPCSTCKGKGYIVEQQAAFDFGVDPKPEEKKVVQKPNVFKKYRK